MKKLENKVMLVLYSDSLGGNLPGLHKILNRYTKEAVGGLHILPLSSAVGDEAMSLMDQLRINSDFDAWKELEKLSEEYYLMVDYRNVFIRYKEFPERGTSWETIKHNMTGLCMHGAAMVRMDPFAFAVEKPKDGDEFEEADLWEMLEKCKEILEPYGVVLFPRIHERYALQDKLSDRGYYIYDSDFTAHVDQALTDGNTKNLKHWMETCRKEQFTMLYPFEHSEDDKAYLFARAVQFFAPGIPQIYYAGRDDGHPHFNAEDIEELMKRPTIAKLLEMLEFRNTCPAFDGTFEMKECSDHELHIIRRNGEHIAELHADFVTREYVITTK